jgi:exodeoxyribonuclease VII large subunit
MTERLYRVSVSVRLQENRRRLERLEQTARERALRRLLGAQASLDRVIAQLEGLNPLAVLRRGYSVVYRADGRTVVHSARHLAQGERIQIRMVDGTVSARVEEKGATTRDERGTGQARYDGAEQLRLDI